MKKFVLIILGIAAWGSIQAQDCMPDTEVPDSVVVAPLPYNEITRPDGGIQDTACVDTYFETVFTFNIPTTYEYQGIEAGITSVDVPAEDGIQDLPASISYSCNPPNCVFEADSSGCIVLYGTPTADEIGEYDLKIEATIRTTLGIDLDVLLPGDLEPGAEYPFFVRDADFENCAVVSTFETFEAQFSLSNQPNPLGDFTQIVVASQVQGDFEFIVTDLLGKVVHRQPVELFEGENTIDFNASQLAEGLYIYAITNGRQMASSKMIVNR